MNEVRLLFSRKSNELDLIREGDMEALTRLYRTNKKPVTMFITHNNGTADEAEDILQEALVILWERARRGNFELSVKPDTFIFATVRNLWLRQLSKKKKENRPDFTDEQWESDDPSSLEMMMSSEAAQLVRESLNELGETCRSLLIAFYWEELSMEEIAERMGFANAQTAKSKKYQCKEALRKLLENRGMET